MLPLHLLGAPLSAAIIVARTPDAGDCPDTEQFTVRVEHIIGRKIGPASGSEGSLFIRADFGRYEEGYQATLHLSGAREGERVLRDQGPTCEALADAVAVATALLFDASPTPGAAREEMNARRPELWLSGRIGVGGGLGGGPSLIAGGTVDLWLEPRTAVTLGATLAGKHEHALGAGTVDVGLWYIELGAFRSLTGEQVQVGPILEIAAGALRGEGHGYPSSSSETLAWFAAGAGVRADLSLGPSLRLGARALMLVPARKHSFSIGYVGTAYESGPIAGAAECALGLKFW